MMDRHEASVEPFTPEPTEVIGPQTTGNMACIACDWDRLGLTERLAAIRSAITGRVVFTTSFGLEDQVIAHTIFTAGLAIEVVTLDTGRLFPETYALWTETERRYGKRIACIMPDGAAVERLVARQGIDGFRNSVTARKACCQIRKVEPLARALSNVAAWITGLRAEQSTDRAAMSFVEWDAIHHVFKANPLLDWRRVDVAAFVAQQDVPYNPLHDRGFLSIGCAPCTRPVRPGEPERAGRWWWERESSKECGLHLGPDGRLVRSVSASVAES
jgi:phosphoadenosine phosphosulfate reductase